MRSVGPVWLVELNDYGKDPVFNVNNLVTTLCDSFMRREAPHTQLYFL